jgi:hypothetical protein
MSTPDVVYIGNKYFVLLENIHEMRCAPCQLIKMRGSDTRY